MESQNTQDKFSVVEQLHVRVVKETSMEKRLMFFIVIFSTSGVQCTQNLCVENNIIAWNAYKTYGTHCRLHILLPSMRESKQGVALQLQPLWPRWRVWDPIG